MRPEMSVAALELRSVVCLPLVQIRSGSSEETRITSTAEATVGLLYMDSRLKPRRSLRRAIASCCRRWRLKPPPFSKTLA